MTADMKIKSFFSRKLHSRCRRTVIDAFAGDSGDADVRYEIVRRTYPVYRCANTLSIEFNNNGSYIYSSVYLSRHRHFQPVYGAAQKTIDAFFRRLPPQDSLVLGCAGCTIPRFLLLHYKNSTVTGIEYSSLFVDIARRYFVSEQMRDRFELINDDAFEYVRRVRGEKRFSLVYTDIYNADIIHPSVFTNEYISTVYDLMRDESIAVINTFRVPLEKTKQFISQIRAPFDVIYIVEHYRKYYVVLMRTDDEKRISDFEKHLPGYAQIETKISKTDRS